MSYGLSSCNWELRQFTLVIVTISGQEFLVCSERQDEVILIMAMLCSQAGVHLIKENTSEDSVKRYGHYENITNCSSAVPSLVYIFQDDEDMVHSVFSN